MVVWGVWWENAFWFSTGPRTRKAKNIEANLTASCTEKADEAVILEGIAQEIKDRPVWKQIAGIYDRKYGGEILPMLESSGGCIFRVEPETRLRPGRTRGELRGIGYAVALPASARLGGRRSKFHVSPRGLLATTDAFQIRIDRANRLVASDKSHIPVGPDQK